MKKLSWNDGWQFAFGDRNWEDRAQSAAVELPHDFIVGQPRAAENPGGPSNGYFPGGRGEYTKGFAFPEEWRDQAVWLYVDGAYMNAEVVLNNDHLATHPYGYTAFFVDLTPSLRRDQENKLTVIAQSRQPCTRWYSGGGLYREVSLYIGPKDGICPWDAFVTTPEVSAERATVRVALGEREDYAVTILDAAGQTVEKGGKEIQIDSPKLWSVENPYLYTARIETAADRHEVAFGIRKIEIDAQRGFRLNGVPMKLKGGCVHHDNGPLGAAAWPKAEERKVLLLKSVGYNAIRSSHNPPSTALLEACDRLGMLVMDEAFDVWLEAKMPLDYHLYFRDWWERDIEAMVLRDRNHPCVFSYSIGNEIGERDGRSHGAAWAKKLADKVRSLDGTRPVASALCNIFRPEDEEKRKAHAAAGGNPIEFSDLDPDFWGDVTAPYASALDIAGYNYLLPRYEHDAKKFPDRVIMGTETFASDTYDYWQATLKNANVAGDFIWTAFDYLGEAGIGRVVWGDDKHDGFCGLYPWHQAYDADFDICGYRRPQSYFREILWGGAKGPYLVTQHPDRFGVPYGGRGWQWPLVQHTWNYPEKTVGKPIQLTAYADAEEIEFVINGHSVGRAPVIKLAATLEATYAPGTIEAVAYKDGAEIGRDILRTTGRPVAIRLTPETDTLRADGRDLCYVTAELLDERGDRVQDADIYLRATLSGAGRVLVVGSSNPTSEEIYTAEGRRTYQGRALIVLKAGEAPGALTLTVEGEGLPEAQAEIIVK